MSHKVFAARDVKADAFGSLIVCPTAGIAKRSFVEACRAQNSPMGQYPEDYMLYELGDYDMSSGGLSGHSLPVLVMTAIEAVAEIRREGLKHQPLLPGVEEAKA